MLFEIVVRYYSGKILLNNKLSFAYSFFYLVISLNKSMNFLYKIKEDKPKQANKADCMTAPKRRCSSHTFRYGYLVTT